MPTVFNAPTNPIILEQNGPEVALRVLDIGTMGRGDPFLSIDASGKVHRDVLRRDMDRKAARQAGLMIGVDGRIAVATDPEEADEVEATATSTTEPAPDKSSVTCMVRSKDQLRFRLDVDNDLELVSASHGITSVVFLDKARAEHLRDWLNKAIPHMSNT